MIELDWKLISEWAGVWGCFLSTLTAFILLRSSLPCVVFYPSKRAENYWGKDEQGITIEISNPSKRSELQITGCCRKYFVGAKIEISPAFDPANTEEIITKIIDSTEITNSGKFNLYISPNSAKRIEINKIDGKTRGLIVFWYHRHGYFCDMPLIVFLSFKRAVQINRGSWGTEIKRAEGAV